MLVRETLKRLGGACAAAGLSLAPVLSSTPPNAEAGFRQWVAGFKATAAKSGVSGAIYDRAFRGIDSADPEVENTGLGR